LKLRDKFPCVQLADFPEANPDKHADILLRWEPLMALRERVSVAVEAARRDKRIGNPLESMVIIKANASALGWLKPFMEILPVVFKVSDVRVEESNSPEEIIHVSPAEGVKCARCWQVKRDVGVMENYEDLCRRCATVVDQQLKEEKHHS
jgi:isoleucyl-tRNA synthetase